MNETMLMELVNDALDKLYSIQKDLIDNEVHERSIVFWFGVYFYESFKDSEFSHLDLDFDYNKHFTNKKTTENHPNGALPDIILHKRGIDNQNLLIIEFKTWWNSDNKDDISKLIDFTKQDGEYKYDLGLSVILNQNTAQIIKVINGEIENE